MWHTNGNNVDTLIGGLRCMSTDHLCLTSMLIELDDIIIVQVLTCKDIGRLTFGSDVMNSNHKAASGDGHRFEGTIETLRLLDFDDTSCFDILNDRKAIQLLGLDKSCKNLLVQIDISHITDADVYINILNDEPYTINHVIKAILHKE